MEVRQLVNLAKLSGCKSRSNVSFKDSTKVQLRSFNNQRMSACLEGLWLIRVMVFAQQSCKWRIRVVTLTDNTRMDTPSRPSDWGFAPLLKSGYGRTQNSFFRQTPLAELLLVSRLGWISDTHHSGKNRSTHKGPIDSIDKIIRFQVKKLFCIFCGGTPDETTMTVRYLQRETLINLCRVRTSTKRKPNVSPNRNSPKEQCKASQQEAVLKATTVRSPLPARNVVDSSLSSLSSLQKGGGGGSGGVGGLGEGGRGHFIQPSITALPQGASP